MTRPLPAALLAALATALLAAPPALAASGGSDAPTSDDSGASTAPPSTRRRRGHRRRDAAVARRAARRPQGALQRSDRRRPGGKDDQPPASRPRRRLDPDRDRHHRRRRRVPVRWKADRAGTFAFRAVLRREGTSAGAAQTSGSMKLRVYKSTLASTFFDRRTACGVTLRRSTLGVAHKSLPCGTKVAFYYRGRTITLPVVDRGPYRRGYSWDLTEAAAAKLRFSGLGRVGSLVVSRPARSR